MSKKVLALLSTTLLLAINMAHAAKSQDNKVCFDNAQIESFTYDSHSITDGQPLDPSSIKIERNCLAIQAGRNKHEITMKWVKQNMESQGVPWDEVHMVASRVNNIGPEAVPDELNFAIKGNLKLSTSQHTFTCHNIHIGQGSYSTNNNWWIFSNNPGTQTIDRWSLKCLTDKGEHILVYPGGANTSNNFTFTIKHEAPDKNPSGVTRNTAS